MTNDADGRDEGEPGDRPHERGEPQHEDRLDEEGGRHERARHGRERRHDQADERRAEHDRQAREDQDHGEADAFAVPQVVEQREREGREERDVERDGEQRVERHRQTAARRASSARALERRSSPSSRSTTGTKRRTSSGSNCAPAWPLISSMAASTLRAGRYGRSWMIAS